MLRTVLLALEGLERRLGWLLVRAGQPVRVHPFAGVGTAEGVRLGGRVVVGGPPRAVVGRARTWAVVRANLQPFLSLEVARARVRIDLGERTTEVRADAGGYVHVLLPGLLLPPGRHPATLTPVDPAGEPAQLVVHVPDPAADLAVVSDVDDTIVDSGIAHGLLATLATTLVREQATRVPLEGAPALYRALAAGGPGGVERPFFYLSTSPWNLAAFLQGFLARHAFPPGPLLLTDWGPGADGLLRVRTRTHKLAALRRLAQAVPSVRFVLIGDSGQEDAPIYAEFALAHPDRVAAVYVRRAGVVSPAAQQRVDAAARALAGAGIAFAFAEDSAALLRHAREHGLLV